MKIFLGLFAIIALTINTVSMNSILDPKHLICSLEDSVAGPCRAHIPSYSYKSDTDECVLFYYGGCPGNDNVYETKEECEKKCKLANRH